MTTTGLALAARRLRRPCTLAGMALLAVALVTTGAVTPVSFAVAAAKVTLQPRCHGTPAYGPFTDGHRDGKPVVLGTGGPEHQTQRVVFDSYGTTVPGLSYTPSYRNLGVFNQFGTWAPIVYGKDIPKIKATALDWCGNTVRLQVSQDDLLGPDGNDYFPAYLTAITDEVQAALHFHLVVVINDNTESAGSVERVQSMPDAGTVRFWGYMAKYWGHNPQVIFDLFNEPRFPSTGNSLIDWCIWRNGGLSGLAPGYVTGLQTLAHDVRAQGARNLFWVEGINYSDSFGGILRAGRNCGLLTGVGPVVYALHHPKGMPTTTSWYFDFGYLIDDDIAPVVVGEWTNFEPGHKTCAKGQTCTPPAPGSTCWTNAATQVPAFLTYLREHGVGLNAYQLTMDWLIKSAYNPLYLNMWVFRDPTVIATSWNCDPYRVTVPDQGAGCLIMKFFRDYNGRQPAIRQVCPGEAPS